MIREALEVPAPKALVELRSPSHVSSVIWRVVQQGRGLYLMASMEVP